jgi:hypothetical protein
MSVYIYYGRLFSSTAISRRAGGFAPSDFQVEIEKIRVLGKLPALDKVLDAVADAREKFAPKILKARKQASNPAT